MKTRRILALAAAVVLLNSCTITQPNWAWVSEADLRWCMTAATNALSTKITSVRLDRDRPVLFRIGDWRQSSITVFLPTSESFGSPLAGEHCQTYFYYKFLGTKTFRGQDSISSISSRAAPEFRLAEEGGVSWPTGAPFRTH